MSIFWEFEFSRIHWINIDFHKVDEIKSIDSGKFTIFDVPKTLSYLIKLASMWKNKLLETTIQDF